MSLRQTSLGQNSTTFITDKFPQRWDFVMVGICWETIEIFIIMEIMFIMEIMVIMVIMVLMEIMVMLPSGVWNPSYSGFTTGLSKAFFGRL